MVDDIIKFGKIFGELFDFKSTCIENTIANKKITLTAFHDKNELIG